MTRLCYFNDCKAGEYKHAVCCFDCDLDDCPERCFKKSEQGCMFLRELKPDEERSFRRSED